MSGTSGLVESATVRFAFSESEFAAASRGVLRRSVFKTRTIAFGAALTAAALYSVWELGEGTWLPVIAYIAVIGGLIYWIVEGKPRSRYRRDSRNRSEVEITLTDGAMSVVSPQATSEIQWSYVARVSENRSFCFFDLGGQRIFAVPKRAFADPVDERDFVDFARKRIGSG